MAYDIGPKIGIEGEKEFRQTISQINTTLRTLGTEMGVVASSFDKGDKSMGAMSAKNQVLVKQIDAQKSKLAELQKGLEASSEKYGENDVKTQKWQQAVNKATAELNNMERELRDNEAALGDTGKGLDEAGDSAEKSGGKFEKLGGVLKASAVALAAVAAAAAAAAVKLGKEVISAYADYEQLVGGVETLFADSSDKVQEYANNAYKTAGLSANQYMETVTAFSASLIQSLGGDTEKAAQYADMAITDMSDNANKMGTDMASIQNAYQGFAKQNYTMLDNLKLGYGGTKSEMERLLADAEKLSGVKYDISSYADIVDALHVVQTEMGITGTTALEAEKTISGSLGMLNSSFKNLIIGLGKSDANMAQLTGNMVNAFKSVVSNVVPIIQNLTTALPAAFDAILSAIGELVPMLLETAVTLFQQVLDSILQMFPELVPVVVAALLTIVDALVENLPMIVDGALQLILALAMGIADALPELIPSVVEAVITIVETLIDNIDMLVTAAIAIIVALAEGLINALPTLIEKAPEILTKLVAAFVENAPKLLIAAAELIVQLTTGLVNGFAEILGKVGGWVSTYILNPISDKVKDFATMGGNLISGLWNGISDKAEWLWNKVKGFFSSLTNRIKDFFGIASPSKVFAEMGGFMAEGLGVGFKDEMVDVNKQIQAAMPQVNLSGTYSLSSGGGGRVINNFNFAPGAMVVRKDSDIGKIAQALYQLQSRASRGVGIA